jgi:hypothetical protein
MKPLLPFEQTSFIEKLEKIYGSAMDYLINWRLESKISLRISSESLFLSEELFNILNDHQ